MLASTFFDMAIGVDIHIVLVPPAAVPTPMPMPFVGMVFDPVGLAVGAAIGCATGGGPGLVMVNSMPATNCGTEVTLMLTAPHIPAPGPFAVGKPGMDAELMFGGLNAGIAGSFGVRLGDIALSCSDPLRLPTSVILAIPKGMPFLILRAPVPDLMTILMGLAMKGAMRALGAVLRALMRGGRALFRAMRAMQRRSGSVWERLARRMHGAVDNLGPRANRVRNFLHDATCFVTGHPVDVATGRLFTECVDLEMPGPLPFRFERRYDSNRSHREGVLGFGWSHTYEQKLWSDRGALVLWDADGREVELSTMHLPGRELRVGAVLEDLMNGFAVRRTNDREYQVRSKSGELRTFRHLGNVHPERRAPIFDLVEIRSSNGAFAIELHHDRDARLTHLRDSCGRLVELAYDSRGRLSYLNAPVRYGERGFLRHRRYEFDGRGDLVQVTDPTGHAYRYEYEAHLLVRETDRAGLSFFFEYDGRTSMAKCVRTWGDGGIYDHVIHYDTKNKKTVVENSCGEVTLYTLDESNMVVDVMDPHGKSTKYEYDPRFMRPLKVERADGSTIESGFDLRGNLVARIDLGGASTGFEYDSSDRLIRIEDPLGGRATFEYDAVGNLTHSVRADGSSSRFQWTLGLLASVTTGSGRWIHFEYESNQVVKVSAPSGTLGEIRYDGRGDVERSRDGRGGQRRVRRDSDGRTVELESAVGVLRAMRYDPEGNLVEFADETRKFALAYGHMHRVVARNEAGATVRMEYDTEDRVVAVVNEAGDRHSFELDACGRVRAEREFDGRARRYLRDELGRVTKVLVADAPVTEVSYDRADRIVRVAHVDGTTTEFAYRVDGAIVRAANESCVVEMERDALGRVLRETVDGVSVESRYGSDGVRTQASTSLGTSWWADLDALGRVEEMGFGVDRHSRLGERVRFQRDASGFETSRRLPGGVQLEWLRDLAGRPLERRTTRLVQNEFGVPSAADGHRDELDRVGYRWRGADQIEARLDPLRGPTFFDHDARGRLVRERRPDHVVERAVDVVGNVYRTPDGRDRTYGAGGRLVRADGVLFTYDDDGNLASRVHPDGTVAKYRWNRSGLLREVERTDGSCVRFEYDAFARRTKKSTIRLDADGNSVVERETRFVWDGDVVVHELDSDRGRTDWFWTPGKLEPIARERDGRRWSVASDHLGTPTEMYDELGELVWKMQLDVFGVPSFEKGDASDCPWRWPGQYEDAETGLHYNRWRYYSPGDGRYQSKDPIGLLGGAEAFAYVRDPLVEFDPFGLAACHDSGARGVAEAETRLAAGGFTITGREVTMTVNGGTTRVRADIVATRPNAVTGATDTFVIEVKNGASQLTPNQTTVGVFDMNNPANTATGIDTSRGTSGTMTVATDNRPAVGARGNSSSVSFLTLHFDV